jgi:NAD(P)-dependent dehydrogenase (short-subunit alcohol dehydrogenase family)
MNLTKRLEGKIALITGAASARRLHREGAVDAVVNSYSDTERARAGLAKSIPMGRLGEADDVAAAVAYLASDDAKFITGVELPIDGGLLAQ